MFTLVSNQIDVEDHQPQVFSRIPQALINLLSENPQHLSLDLIITQKQGKEVLVLLQTFDQRIVDVIKVGKFEVFLGVVFRAGFQLLRFQQDVTDLQHGFDGDVVVVALTGLAVDLSNDL